MRRLLPVRPVPHRWLPALLAAALVLAQALALLHGVLHASPARLSAHGAAHGLAGHEAHGLAGQAAHGLAVQPAHAGHGPAAALARPPADAQATAAASWLDSLFAGHAQPGDCRLVDALLQAGPCPALPAFAALAPQQPAAPLDLQPAWLREPRHFDARGPPALR
jgi:hypothetical protein